MESQYKMCSATKEQRVKVFFKNKVRLNKLEKNRFNIVGQLVSLKKRNQEKPSIAFFPWSFFKSFKYSNIHKSGPCFFISRNDLSNLGSRRRGWSHIPATGWKMGYALHRFAGSCRTQTAHPYLQLKMTN